MTCAPLDLVHIATRHWGEPGPVLLLLLYRLALVGLTCTVACNVVQAIGNRAKRRIIEQLRAEMRRARKIVRVMGRDRCDP